METKLFEAALSGNVRVLHQLFQENPLILADYSLLAPLENPLHVATKAGHAGFVQEVLKLKPDAARELNKEGFRPLDVASAFGYVEIAKELIVKSGSEICRLEGREGRTALHYAVINGKNEIVDELLSLESLFEWMQKLGLEEMVNWGDKDGNTVLHLAVARKQHQGVQLLLRSSNISSTLELNATNLRGLTAMDVIDILIETPSDVQLREILHRAGALRAQNSQLQVAVNVPNNQQENTSIVEAAKKDWIKYFCFKQERDSPSDTRNALLVVAALIATVTFQAGVNPPSGVNAPSGVNPPSGLQVLKGNTNTREAQPPRAYRYHPDHPVDNLGLAALSTGLGSTATASNWFLLGNSLGLATSVSVIIYLTTGFPFQRELHISIYSMMFAYGWSVNIDQSNKGVRYLILGIAFLVPFLIRWLPRWVRKVLKDR
ncbi:hypothetical protein UlMin_036740 [Ulmus minor]